MYTGGKLVSCLNVCCWDGKLFLYYYRQSRLPQRLSIKELSVVKGTVKWFNPTKGYGFIQPEQGGSDVFVHISALESAGISSLDDGQVVSYELTTNKGKTSAANLQLADA